MKHFSELKVWQLAHGLALEIYSITEQFPKSEIFGMTNQMRRCSVSVASNIAEGFGRHGKKDKARFYTISRGSLLELESQLLLSKDLKWVSAEDHVRILKDLTSTHKALNGLIRSLK